MLTKIKPSQISDYMHLLIFASSLFFPAFYFEGNSGTIEPYSALACFLTGWISIFGFCYGLSWFANIFFMLAFILMTRKKLNLALLSSITALLFALSFLLVDEVMINEGGDKGVVTGYAAGYYLWIISMVVYFIKVLKIKIEEYNEKN